MIWRFFLHKHVFLYIFFYFPNVFYAPAAAIPDQVRETWAKRPSRKKREDCISIWLEEANGGFRVNKFYQNAIFEANNEPLYFLSKFMNIFIKSLLTFAFLFNTFWT